MSLFARFGNTIVHSDVLLTYEIYIIIIAHSNITPQNERFGRSRQIVYVVSC